MSNPVTPQKIAHLLNANEPDDALKWYYAYKKSTNIYTFPPNNQQATSYLAFSRIGWDLFRMLLTYHLPSSPEEAADLIYHYLAPDTSLWIIGSEADYHLLSAFFTVQSQKTLLLYAYDHSHSVAPHVNVLVQQKTSPTGYPQFVIQQPDDTGQLTSVASATLNWQSPYFAEVNVQTQAPYRRQGWGRAVVAALTQHIVATGRTPLYTVEEHNTASHRLAKTLGYRQTGYREMMLEAVLRPRPQ